MADFIMFIDLAALVGSLCFIILAIKSIVKKEGKTKKRFQLAGISFIIFFICLIFGPQFDVELTGLPEDQTITLNGNEGTFTIEGKVLYQDWITINDEEITTNSNDEFSVEKTIQEGKNTFVVKAGNSDNEVEKIVTITGKKATVNLSTSDETVYADKHEIVITSEPGAKVRVFDKNNKEVHEDTLASDSSSTSFSINLSKNKTQTFEIIATKDGYKDSKEKITITRKQSEAEKKAAETAEKKKSAQTIEYKKLKKSADRYAGEYVKYTGKVIQMVEGSNQTDLRIAVEQDSWGYDYDTIIYVSYDGFLDDVYEDDVVTFYGTIYGDYSYESTAGWQITVPMVMADEVK